MTDREPAADMWREAVETQKNLAAALAAFQAELPNIGKDSKATVPGKDGKAGYSYRYADLASISAVALPIAAKHGLSFSARPTLDGQGRFVLAYALRHSSGESDTGAYPLPPATAKPQEIGSAITYARRYALCSVLGIAPDEDDDGQAAPPASRQPVERHESTWDADEQDMLRDAYMADLAKATTLDELRKTGDAVRRQVAAGDISPATNRALADAAARRVAEIQAPPEQAVTE